MRTRFGRMSRDELRQVCVAKGWTRQVNGKFNKEAGEQFLANLGLDMMTVWNLVKNLRAAARGSLTATPQVTNINQTTGVDREAVERIVAEKIQSAVSAATLDVSKGELAKMIADAVQKASPHKIILQGEKDTKPVKLNERTHPVFEKVLRLVQAELNVLLVGPAGCGKTTLAHMISRALKRKYGTLHCTSGASESQLTGWLLPVGEGKDKGAFTYVASEFVELYEGGNSVFLLDEIDAADPNMLLVINSALANGAVHIPQRHQKPTVTRGKNVAIISAANTFGNGADAMYAGRNQLDAATLDRFYVVKMDYDEALEADIMGHTPPVAAPWNPAPKETYEADVSDLATWVKQLRVLVAQNRLRRVVGTRTFQKAVTARKVGVPVHEIKRDLLSGWTRDEAAKCNVLEFVS